MNRLLPLLLLPAAVLPLFAEDWPQFRGPTGQGIAQAKGLPVEWDSSKNVAWKQPIPGLGWSSPILWKGRIYLTSAVPIPNSETKDLSLKALCLEAKDGKILWEKEVFRQDGKTAPKIHGKNSHASPTPLIDGQRLYVHFGHQGTAALDLDGNLLWANRELNYRPVHGNGGSPILHQGKLIFNCDGGDKQFVVALDAANGQVLWKTKRQSPNKGFVFAFGTPILIQVAGKDQVVSPGAGVVCGYDPADGQELWRVDYLTGYSVVPRPVFGQGLVFLSSGYNVPKLLAVKPDGQGNVTSSHIVWSTEKGAPHNPSPLVVGTELYVVSDAGIASCFDARTGKVHWQERLAGHFSASPLYADGRLYFQSEEGVGFVLKSGPRFELLAQNDLGEKSLASYAVDDGALFIRTAKHLYRIQQP